MLYPKHGDPRAHRNWTCNLQYKTVGGCNSYCTKRMVEILLWDNPAINWCRISQPCSLSDSSIVSPAPAVIHNSLRTSWYVCILYTYIYKYTHIYINIHVYIYMYIHANHDYPCQMDILAGYPFFRTNPYTHDSLVNSLFWMVIQAPWKISARHWGSSSHFYGWTHETANINQQNSIPYPYHGWGTLW